MIIVTAVLVFCSAGKRRNDDESCLPMPKRTGNSKRTANVSTPSERSSSKASMSAITVSSDDSTAENQAMLYFNSAGAVENYFKQFRELIEKMKIQKVSKEAFFDFLDQCAVDEKSIKSSACLDPSLDWSHLDLVKLTLNLKEFFYRRLILKETEILNTQLMTNLITELDIPEITDMLPELNIRLIEEYQSSADSLNEDALMDPVIFFLVFDTLEKLDFDINHKNLFPPCEARRSTNFLSNHAVPLARKMISSLSEKWSQDFIDQCEQTLCAKTIYVYVRNQINRSLNDTKGMDPYAIDTFNLLFWIRLKIVYRVYSDIIIMLTNPNVSKKIACRPGDLPFLILCSFLDFREVLKHCNQ